ncbi:MAG: GNAT family N-acetyltransferase [Armatimonadetes bacterium]|nr:GNAT family N-acetyltransferase [Armatimonadota bacterium]
MKYLPGWQAEHPLKDGTLATIRLVRPSDKAIYMRAAEEFSADAMTRRFFTPKPRFTNAELAYLTEVDGTDHFALVAVRDLSGEAEIQGLGAARFVRDGSDPTEAEFAIIVGDPWQREGLGSALLTHLIAAARERGIEVFKGDILASNTPAFGLIDAFAPGADWLSNGIISNVRFRL